MRYVLHGAMVEFEKRFPDAASFLRHESLKGELFTLESRSKFMGLNKWEVSRLKDLRALRADWDILADNEDEGRSNGSNETTA
jgi:hypothetical protein